MLEGTPDETRYLCNLQVAMAVGRELPSFVSLTLAGWQKYEELRRSVKYSRKAFVAMEFPKERSEQNYFFQETLFDKYLVPAVKKTGYDLANPLRSEPMAGNLHARLEVEIRSSRFIVAELSHHNNGAYGKRASHEVSESRYYTCIIRQSVAKDRTLMWVQTYMSRGRRINPTRLPKT